jgi:aspartyl-tRNA synthetase
VARFIDELKRTHDCGAIRASDIGKEVVLFGWVQIRRDHGSIVFVDLRDREGVTQVVFDPETSPSAHTVADQLRSEWVIGIRGLVRSRDARLELCAQRQRRMGLGFSMARYA